MTLPRVYPILDTETLVNRGVGIELAAAAFLGVPMPIFSQSTTANTTCGSG